MSVSGGADVTLDGYLDEAASRFADRLAVVDTTGAALTYRELQRSSNNVARFLRSQGVERGDRVALVVPKSVSAVTALFGILKCGAAYVPVDFAAPPARNKAILTDSMLRAAIVDADCLQCLPDGDARIATVVVVSRRGAEAEHHPEHFPWEVVLGHDSIDALPGPSADNLAYILYTSGSTGMPKGVMLSHRNATSFVDWCSSVFSPTEADRFSSHAPFHFDLSVLDLFLAIKHAATVYLISDELGKNPRELSAFIAQNRLTIWYSTPSILSLLAEFGNLEAFDYSDLRLVLFAGEVFPIKHLRNTVRRWPHPRYFNLYGPTETNVCTFAEIPALVPEDRVDPYPIGWPCSHCQALVLDEPDGREVQQGDEGILYISGPSVFRGYWNRPVENAAAFIDRDAIRWYNTGDVVRMDPLEGFVYLGRRDRMVKRRGYRIELGEIESGLYRHRAIREAAVITEATESGVRIAVYVVAHEGQRPSIIELKTHCATALPAYMNPDFFFFLDHLPRTSTNKVDYQALRTQLAQRIRHD